MGIRMHIAAGYGLDLSELPFLDKNRLNYEFLEDRELRQAWEDETMSFAKANDELVEKMVFHERMNPPKYIGEVISYDAEFADKNRLVLTPAGQHKDWQRYGDLLDAYLVEAQRGGLDFDMSPEWLPHPGVLYPYINLMKDNPKHPLGIEKYWVSCYKNHPEHKDAIAWAPWHLYFLIKVLFDVSDVEAKTAFLALRPGVYRYFS